MNDPLQAHYQKKKKELQIALQRFQKIGLQDEQTLFAELCFCLCTPQSKAYHCDHAIQTLVQTGLLYTGNEKQISHHLVQAGVRFHKNKARYITDARTHFQNRTSLTMLLQQYPDPLQLREWLVTHIKGLGYKEASHFIRNIGRGEKLTILDRHILRNLMKYHVIKRLPKTLTRKKYMTIEKKMHTFAQTIQIPVQELDLLFWSQETGAVFK